MSILIWILTFILNVTALLLLHSIGYEFGTKQYWLTVIILILFNILYGLK